MQNLFYVPPHQPRDSHPRTPGVKSVVKPNQPERLVFSTTYAGATTMAVTVPHIEDREVVRTTATGTLRALIGRTLIRLGHWIAPSDPTGLNGQPLGQL